MAKPWAEVAKSDGYRALSSAEREEARNEYWREVVAPRVPVAELMGVRQAFDADTAPGLVAQIKRQLSPPSLPAAANDAVALPQPAPQLAPEAYAPSNAPGSMDAYRARDLPADSAAFGVAPRMGRKAPTPVLPFAGALASTDAAQSLKKGLGAALEGAGQIASSPAAFLKTAGLAAVDTAFTGPGLLLSQLNKWSGGDGKTLGAEFSKAAHETYAPLYDELGREMAQNFAQGKQDDSTSSNMRLAGRFIQDEAAAAMSDAAKLRDQAYEQTEGFGALDFLVRRDKAFGSRCGVLL